MKKAYLVAMPLLFITLLSACNNSKGSDKLMISEYIPDADKNNQAIEIYNDSDSAIDLKDYSIAVYSTKDANTPRAKIALEGTIEAKKTFVLANTNASSEILAKANQKADNLSFGGIEGVSLMYKNDNLDAIGALGKRNNNENAFVRKTWMTTPSTTFDTYNYLYYNASDAVKFLGEFKNSVTLDDLLAGPKFLDEYLEIDYYTYSTSYYGNGGAVEVTLQGNIDGDTSYFYFPSKANITAYAKDCVYNSSKGEYYTKVRYQEVDTPETQVQNNKVEIFGWPAKLNTADLQNNADHIYVQSNPGKGIVENYGRMLGFVFVKKGNDSTLVNFDTIKKGYSTASLVFNGDISYKDCPYYNFFVEAKKYAEDNKKGLYGEIDPYWDYVNNKSIYL